MRPALILLALAALVGLAWTFVRGIASDGAPELPVVAMPSEVAVGPGDGPDAVVVRDDVERREVEPRAEEGDPADPAADLDASSAPLVDPATAGLLEVRIVGLETREPIPGAIVHVQAAGGPENAGVQWLGGDRARPPTTDEAGLARFHLAPDVDYQLWARDPSGAGDQVGDSVAPLRAGEGRAITLRLRTRPDLKIVGRVIDGSTRAGVADARVRFASARMGVARDGTHRSSVEVVTELRTDADGWFEGEAASWRQLHGRVEAAGYGPSLFTLRQGAATREDAVLVELFAGATLRGRVLGAEDTTSLVVQATADGHALMARADGVMTWAGEVRREVGLDPDGRWELRDLPPRVGLKLELLRGHGVVRREPDPVTLAPGETLELEWRLGAGALLAGRITLADDGAPLGRHAIWLLPAKDASGPFQFGSAPTASVETDDEGRFAFADVIPGEWKVGPAPVRGTWDRPGPTDVVARGEAVVVPAGVASVEVELTAYRGLFIRGEVLAPDGARLRGGWVWGHDSAQEMWLDAQVHRGGFVLGPLVPGTYSLTASGSGGKLAPSLPVEARAGEEGVVLRLRVGGAIHGRLLDAASGDPLTGEVLVVQEGQVEGGPTMTLAQADGRFELNGVLPGTYRLRGSSGALVGERRGVIVGPEATVRDVDVRLSTGVALEVGYGGVRSGGWYQVESEGVPLSFQSAEPGQRSTTRHPPGRYTVRLSLPSAAGAGRDDLVREVDLAHEAVVVEFDDDGE